MRPATVVRILAGVGGVWALTGIMMLAGGDPGAGDLLGQLVAVTVVAGGLAWAVYRFRILPRRGSFEDQAKQAGMRAGRGDPLGLLHQPFSLFGRPASARDLENTAWGRWHGRETVVADYWYAPTSDASRDDYRRFVCVIDAPRPSWPDVSVVPRSLASVVRDAVDPDDMELESERFNRTFEVRTSDRRFASALLDARMIEWLLLQAPGVGLDVVAGRLMVFGPRQAASIDDVDRALRRFDGFLEHVPAVLESLFPDPRPATATTPP
ncbi:MAG: hypothetical protein ACRDHI_05565 [Actinomycetota bacterium]